MTSIIYDGITFNKVEEVNVEQAAVSMSVNPIAVSERAFGIEIKLTAKNEAGKKVLKENAEKISSSLKVEKDGMIATAGSFFGADKLSGDSLTLRLFGDIFNKRIDTVPITIKLDSETPQAVIDALGGNNSATVFFKKTVNDKLFVSESGEHFWLSDYFATTDHNPTAPKLPFVILKLKDGTEVSTKDIGLTEGGNHGNGKINKQFTYVFDGKFQKGIDNVVSISYDGVEFTPQGDAKISIEKTIDEAKKAYIEATIEKQKLIKKNPNANTKEYDSAMIEAAKYIAQNKGSDILCAGLTSDKHFIAAACFSGNNAQKVKACADKMAQQGIRYNWFILIDKSGNELCKCYIDWCHMISGNAYVQIYSENAVSFAALPDGAVLRCLTDSSFADISVSLTDGDLGTTLFNNIKQ